MNRVWLGISIDGQEWYARVGEAYFKGKEKDCVAWLLERQLEVAQLSQEIHARLAAYANRKPGIQIIDGY